MIRGRIPPLWRRSGRTQCFHCPMHLSFDVWLVPRYIHAISACSSREWIVPRLSRASQCSREESALNVPISSFVTAEPLGAPAVSVYFAHKKATMELPTMERCQTSSGTSMPDQLEPFSFLFIRRFQITDGHLFNVWWLCIPSPV